MNGLQSQVSLSVFPYCDKIPETISLKEERLFGSLTVLVHMGCLAALPLGLQ